MSRMHESKVVEELEKFRNKLSLITITDSERNQCDDMFKKVLSNMPDNATSQQIAERAIDVIYICAPTLNNTTKKFLIEIFGLDANEYML